MFASARRRMMLTRTTLTCCFGFPKRPGNTVSPILGGVDLRDLDTHLPDDAPAGIRPKRGRWRLVAAVVAALALAAVAAVLVARRLEHRSAPAPAALSTAAVTRSDLADTQPIDGTLGYAGSYSVVGGGSGTITWLPAPGQVIRRGHAVYRVDGADVPLFYGAAPLWQTLQTGVDDGPDVLLLERNLWALGYRGFTVDDHFSSSTAEQVRHWQRDRKVTETGSVAAADVVVMPAAIRVATVGAAPGATAQGTVLTASSTRRIVVVNVPVNSQDLAVAGARVTTQLPGGGSAGGRITSVGTVATAPAAGGGTAAVQPGQSTQNATVQVEITLDNPKAGGRLDGAPVTVQFTGAVHRGVLAVPVNALLAQPGGGYAVSLVDRSGGTRPVSVQLGLFAAGQVEVKGDLAAGDRVQVPAS
jgi:peptidoglycan hydrolase-like protein with peptidoglycan-binding domain